MIEMIMMEYYLGMDGKLNPGMNLEAMKMLNRTGNPGIVWL